MPRTQITGQNVGDGTILRSDLNTNIPGSAVTTKILTGSSSRISLSSTGADSGTGDVTVDLGITGFGSGTYVKVTTDIYGRVIGSSLLEASDIPDISATYVARSGSTMLGGLIVAASDASRSGLRLVPGVAPSSPVSGDLFSVGTDINYYDGATTQVVAYRSYVDTRVRYRTPGIADPVPPSFVDNGNGTLTIASSNVALNSATDFTGNTLVYSVSGTTLALTEGTQQFVCVRYNSGSPEYYVENSRTNINSSSIIAVYTVWRVGNEIHSVSFDSRGLGLASKIAQMITMTKPYSLASGSALTLGETSTPSPRTVTITSALVFVGTDAQSIAAFNSSTGGHRLTRVYPIAGVWTYLNETVYDNLYYSNGTNLVAANNNKYLVRWFYRTIGDDVQTFYVLGSDQYNSVDAARQEPAPSNIPMIVQEHALLVGRIIVLQGASSGVVDNIATTVFQGGSGITDHNALSNLQGGSTNEYYHLSATSYTFLTGLTLNTFVQNQSASAQTASMWVSGSVGAGSFRIYSGANYVGLSAGSLSGNVSLVLPVNTGSAGNIMSTDGTGTLSFIAAPWVRSGTQVNLSTTTDKVTIGSTSNNAGVLGVEGGSVRLAMPSSVVSLLHFDSRSGSRQFVDLCGNRWTSGSAYPAQLSSAQARFGNTSLLLNGTTQYVEMEGSSFTPFSFGTGTFTVDLHVRFTATTGTQTLVDLGGTAAGLVVRFVSGTGLQVVVAGSTFNFAWSPATATWYHVAVVRSGTSLSAYVGGSGIGTTQTSSGSITCSHAPCIGSSGSLSGTALRTNFFSGHIDELRISNTAVWTTAFTAPTSAYDYATYSQVPTSSNPVESGYSFVSDGQGNATLQPPRRVFTAVFVLTENVANTTKYFYPWSGNGTTQDDSRRSGNTSGVGNANSCSPIKAPFNGRIAKATLSVQGCGVNAGSVTYPCAYQTTFHRVGWTTENDPNVGGGTPVAINFPIPSGVGTYSVAATNAVVDISNLNIQVSAGDKMALKFVNGGTSALVGLTQQAVVTVMIEEVF